MIIIQMLQTLFYSIAPFIILLGILIFVHEFGHYAVARLCGVRVETFSLGFGKKIFQFKKGDTTYALSLIPLGGYVKMYGELGAENIPDEEKKFSFTHKTVGQRIAIVLAGPLMNFAFAVFLFFVISLIGEQQRQPVLGDIAENTLAYSAGVRSGDRIITVNSHPVESWEEITKLLMTKEQTTQDISLTLKHENEDVIYEDKLLATSEPNPNPLALEDYVFNIPGISSISKGTTVGIIHGSTLANLGVKAGSQILSLNDQAVSTWRELNSKLSEATFPLSLKVRTPELSESTVTIAQEPTGGESLMTRLGLESSELYIQKVTKDSPAETAGLQAGDRISAINETPVNEWSEVLNSIKAFDGKNPVAVSVVRLGETIKLSMTPKMTIQMTPVGTEDKRFTIGIASTANFADVPTFKKTYGVVGGVVRGYERTVQISAMTVMSFVKLVQAKISPKNIGGVISIGQAASESFKIGIEQFIHMMAVISVNLFILNLLPVPVLDGGHLVFYIVEAIKGSPVSIKKMEIAQQFGLAMLMMLMGFALINDFTRVLGL